MLVAVEFSVLSPKARPTSLRSANYATAWCLVVLSLNLLGEMSRYETEGAVEKAPRTYVTYPRSP